jgi:hypothetical protein
MRRALACVFMAVVLAALGAPAQESNSEKRFAKPAKEVFEAAERVVERMRVQVRERDVRALRLVFSDMRSSGESYTGYQATFEAETDPKSGKTVARLRTRAVSWSATGGAPSRLGWPGAGQFFADLKRELGLSNRGMSSPITGGGGLNTPRTH